MRSGAEKEIYVPTKIGTQKILVSVAKINLSRIQKKRLKESITTS